MRASKREDEVKVSGAMSRLAQEDPSLSFQPNPDTQEAVLWGQGEMHLKVALDRLAGKYGLSLQTERPKVAYKEAIRKPVSQHARFKKQTGGHGQFGDVHIDVKPLPRGTGFEFQEKVVGGAVPRQYIPAVEAGVRDYLTSGPLGFPVVDVSVTLTDGKHHSVDSSEMAFKTAGRMAMAEALPKCNPVLLEPICEVRISIPSEFTPNVQRLGTGRRGQVLGFQTREDWSGWDEVTSQMPQAEMHDLIIELRSLTLGVGTFEAQFDRLQELTGRLADDVLAAAEGGRLTAGMSESLPRQPAPRRTIGLFAAPQRLLAILLLAGALLCVAADGRAQDPFDANDPLEDFNPGDVRGQPDDRPLPAEADRRGLRVHPSG